MPDISYDIISFDPATAQIVVTLEAFDAPFAIDLPVDDEGRLPTGPELDKYIRGFIPYWEIERRQKLQQGVANAAEIEALVRPAPVPELPPAPTPEQRRLALVISDRQFFQQAAIDGHISVEDALAAVRTGFIPAPLQQIIDQIPDENAKLNATFLLSGATQFQRVHPLTDVIGFALGMDPEDVDAFFERASRL